MDTPDNNQQLPHPDSEPDFQQAPQPEAAPAEVPGPEHVDVTCPGCMTVYGFDVQPNTDSFTFKCQKCNTQSEWKRVEG